MTGGARTPKGWVDDGRPSLVSLSKDGEFLASAPVSWSASPREVVEWLMGQNGSDGKNYLMDTKEVGGHGVKITIQHVKQNR